MSGINPTGGGRNNPNDYKLKKEDTKDGTEGSEAVTPRIPEAPSPETIRESNREISTDTSGQQSDLNNQQGRQEKQGLPEKKKLTPRGKKTETETPNPYSGYSPTIQEYFQFLEDNDLDHSDELAKAKLQEIQSNKPTSGTYNSGRNKPQADS